MVEQVQRTRTAPRSASAPSRRPIREREVVVDCVPAAGVGEEGGVGEMDGSVPGRDLRQEPGEGDLVDVGRVEKAEGGHNQPRRRNIDKQAHGHQDLEADAEAEEGAPAADVADHPAEVLAEEAGEEAQGQEDGGDDGQLLHDLVEPVGDGGQVGVHGPGQQIAVAVDQVAQADEVVVEVAEVALGVGRHAREGRLGAGQGGEHVALGRDHLAQLPPGPASW